MFGGLRLQRGETTILRFRTRQTAALLAYLAYFPRPHSRESLVEQFWPDSAPDKGRNNLRVALTSLRHQLEPPDVLAGTSILANHRWVQIQPNIITTDVRCFEDALVQATQNPLEQESHLAAALSLYDGPLLPGFYDSWIPLEENRLEELFLDAARRLVALHLDRKDQTTARQWLHHVARVAPHREEVQKWIGNLSMPGRLTTPIPLQNSKTKQSRLQTVEPFTVSAPSIASPRVTSPTTLPPSFNRFFGRESEIACVSGLLQTAHSHLITLTGPGGCGKTRLALEIARQQVEQNQQDLALGQASQASGTSIFFVPLADVTDAAFISDALVAALALPPSSSSTMSPPSAPALNRVIEALSHHSQCLLLLDNFEHLLPSGALIVQQLLQQVPSLRCLITTRQRLDLPGESEVPIGPMEVPDKEESDPARLHQLPSVRLFVDRAQARRPDFQITPHNAVALAQLIRRLEGMPIALELCAAQSRVLSPRQILTQLENQQSDLLGLSPTRLGTRHNSLRATFEWSYGLLTPPLQQVFRSLAIFRGGFSIEAANAVCHEDLVLPALAFLRDASLVQSSEIVVAPNHSEMRFSLLETVRAFVEEKLTPGEHDEIAARHATHYLELAQSIKAAPYGSLPGWNSILEREQDNFWAALQWSSNSRPEWALRFVPALNDYWLSYQPTHGRKAAEQLASLILTNATGGFAALQSQVLRHAGELALRGHDFPNAHLWLQASLLRAQTAQDLSGQAATLSSLGLLALEEHRLDDAHNYFEQALALGRENNDEPGIAWMLRHRGALLRQQGNYQAAQECLQESLALFQTAQDNNGIAWVCLNLAGLLAAQGEWNEARLLCDEALAYFRLRGHKSGLMWTLHQRGEIALHFNEPDAQELLEESLAIAHQLDDQTAIGFCLKSLGSPTTA
jgi:predicted ATPase